MTDRTSPTDSENTAPYPEREGDAVGSQPPQYPRSLTSSGRVGPRPPQINGSQGKGSSDPPVEGTDEAEEAPESIPTPLKLIAGLVTGLLGILLYSQIVTAFDRIHALAPPLQVPLLGVLILLLFLTAFSTIELLRRYIRLKKKGDYLSKRLESRLELRKCSAGAGGPHRSPPPAEIRDKLLLYLRDYDLEEQRFCRDLKHSGLDEETIDALKWERRSLLDTNARRSSQDWIREFADRFQGKLDTAAEKLIRRKAVYVGAKTAASPFRILDIVAVIYNQATLMRGLGQIYNLRPDARETVVLLVKAIAGVYVASALEELDSSAFGEDLRDELGRQMGSEVFGLISTRLASGVVNALFLYRTGKWAQQKLRFVRPSQKGS